MSLIKKIDNDKIAAMKAKEVLRLSVLRMLLAAIKNEEIAQRAELDDQAVWQVLRREKKKRAEASEAFAKAGRDELAAKEAEELSIIETYLPAQMSIDELKTIIIKILTDNNLDNISQFGKAMGLVVKEVAGRADGQVVQVEVKAFLSK